jgi:alpha-D-xyloside xylohydrolase
VTFHVFELADGASCSTMVPTLKDKIGLSMEVQRRGQEIDIRVDGTVKDWRVLLRGISTALVVDGGTVQSEGAGVIVIPEAGRDHLQIRL